MPALPEGFRDILDIEPLPLTAEGAEVFERFSVAQMRVIVERAHNLFGNGMGPVLVDLGLSRDEIPALLTPDALASHPGARAVMAGERPLRSGDDAPDLIRIFQHAIQAVSARVPGAPDEMRLASWGADGGFGGELTRALAAFRKWLGPGWADGSDRELGSAEARKLADLLDLEPVPALWADVPVGPVSERGARRIVDIATGICDSTADVPFTRRVDGRVYRYTAAHFGVPAAERGVLRAPGGVGYTLRTGVPGYWKCNIFGGTVVALAELPVPTFTVGRYRHFPRAERFGDRLAKKPGWRLVRYLDLRDPDDPQQALSGPSHDGQIASLLAEAKAGDMFFVDHPGEPGDNGGHTRVCTAEARHGDPDRAPLWAQATEDAAIERRDGLSMLGDGQECQFWLLRYEGQ